jgi:hypothetical protein
LELNLVKRISIVVSIFIMDSTGGIFPVMEASTFMEVIDNEVSNNYFVAVNQLRVSSETRNFTPTNYGNRAAAA